MSLGTSPTYKCFASNCTYRNQFISINVFNLDLADTICKVPRGSMLGSLLFLVYINDIHAITYYEVHHFADDSNLMNFQACQSD